MTSSENVGDGLDGGIEKTLTEKYYEDGSLKIVDDDVETDEAWIKAAESDYFQVGGWT